MTSRIALSDRREWMLILAVLLTRILLVFVGFVAVATKVSPPGTEVDLDLSYLRQEISAFRYADAEWYAGITEHGYADREFTDDRKENWAFFPLWPLIWRAIWRIPPSPILAALAVNTALFMSGLVLVYRLLKLDFDRDLSFDTALLTTLFPAAYFAFRPGPEAVFFVTTVGALYAARRSTWWLSGILAALATLSRPQGILVLLPLLFIYWRGRSEGSTSHLKAAWLGLAPLALASFMVYLHRLTGNAFASFAMQKAWDSSLTFPFYAVVHWLADPKIVGYYGFDLPLVSVPAALVATALTVVMARRRDIPSEYLLYAAPSLFFTVSRVNSTATLRYLLPVFPLFLVLAMLVRSRPSLRYGVALGFFALQTFFFAFFVMNANWAAN